MRAEEALQAEIKQANETDRPIPRKLLDAVKARIASAGFDVAKPYVQEVIDENPGLHNNITNSSDANAINQGAVELLVKLLPRIAGMGTYAPETTQNLIKLLQPGVLTTREIFNASFKDNMLLWAKRKDELMAEAVALPLFSAERAEVTARWRLAQLLGRLAHEGADAPSRRLARRPQVRHAIAEPRLEQRRVGAHALL